MAEPVRSPQTGLYVPRHPVRFVTAASLFDGHDAAINIIRRLLQAQGAEVIHLGHNRSVEDIVTAAVAEDVQGVAVSSYQGGHLEFFPYLVDRLRDAGRPDVRVYGGGGGVIVPEEIARLEAYGVARIFSPADGQRLGLEAMVNVLVQECDVDLCEHLPASLEALWAGERVALARVITGLEAGRLAEPLAGELAASAARRPVPVLGITGTGGSGKSSLTDELVLRFRNDLADKLAIAVLAVDPTRRRGGGALLGDRIRMNAIASPQVYVRSLATRGATTELPSCLPLVVGACRAAGFDLVIVETPGIGQGDAAIAEVADLSLYVMTPEFGAASQLEKIDMLELADLVAINKFERLGGEDTLRAVRRQWARNHPGPGPLESLPVFGTIASRFNDDGVTALYAHVREELVRHGLELPPAAREPAPAGPAQLNEGWQARRTPSPAAAIVPASRRRYLAEVAEQVRSYHAETAAQVAAARRAQQVRATLALYEQALYEQCRGEPGGGEPGGGEQCRGEQGGGEQGVIAALAELAERTEAELSQATRDLLAAWPATLEAYSAKTFSAEAQTFSAETFSSEGVRAGRAEELPAGRAAGGRAVPSHRRSLSGTDVPRIALPCYEDHGELLKFLRAENLPGRFPFTAGVFPFKREEEDPTRMFAGEGDPARTNRRFHLLAAGQPATRLSVAFDSVTLYGFDPDERPDIYGKVGTSGVSVATLEDMADLFAGFDLCEARTSVSMTINGPAPIVLAMFLNAAIDQQLATFAEANGRPPSPAEAATVRSKALRDIRGTVQADILKEDQGQNTCIFSTDFALTMMADMQQFFVDHAMGNFYSVSISGYHIAEAGANPITQLAFTLANGFTYVESYLARGMAVDDFAPNLSFFFSNGMDPEYSVIGRVARRIWAIAMRQRYGASERSQRLKYHVQTSGRSLHAQEMAFNDIRTTLQALCAIYDNANSLHTNAYDEAVTTPSADSVRRALAIQMVINKEWGLAANDNPLQGSFVIEELTDLVEASVLAELDRIDERGGVLGAMETGYQRGRIQDDSMLYEERKHDGTLPIVGVNTFVAPESDQPVAHLELAHATESEKRNQLARLRDFRARHAADRPAALAALQQRAVEGGNLFTELMTTVRHASLGEITDALFEVGGSYRRNM